MIQGKLFNPESDWEKEWRDMPEYKNSLLAEPKIKATFKFKDEKDYEHFKNVVQKYLYDGKKVFDGMQKKNEKQTWYPLKKKASDYKYVCNPVMNPAFPLYIISKGRWERNPTSKTLDAMNLFYYLVIEEKEYKEYSKKFDKNKILIIPQKYFNDYDTFWKDDDKRTGAGVARNFCWEHSLNNRFKWHWVMDDNIESFERLNNNLKVNCMGGNIFNACENFALRYSNIGQAGLQYSIFCPASDNRPAFKVNTRIYSCLLINNSIPFRWRGRYNEDTDLSLRILKSGLCTVQFNAFLQGKRATQTVGGGNTKEFYSIEGTLNKSKMLADMHPDLCTVTKKFNRWHHHVNYKAFKRNKLIRKENLIIPNGINNYGMKLIEK